MISAGGRHTTRMLGAHVPVWAYEFDVPDAPVAWPAVSFGYGSGRVQEVQFLFPGFAGGGGTRHKLNEEHQALAAHMVRVLGQLRAHRRPERRRWIAALAGLHRGARRLPRAAGAGTARHHGVRRGPPLRLLGPVLRLTAPSADERAHLVSYLRLLYRAERDATGWRLRSLDGVYERDTLTAAVPGAVLDVDPAALAGFRPSYRCLAWVLDRLGYQVDPDLPGDDRPDVVARLTKEARTWLVAHE
ncbi:hypothetical protein [Dactylosporangium cerinum]